MWGGWVHHSWRFGHAEALSRNAWTRIKNVNGASRLSNFWNFFSAIQMISCRDWRPWAKPSYITMTWRQSNNQWCGGIAVHPAPYNSECKNPLKKFSPLFFGIKTASSWLIIFQMSKLSTPSITHLYWCKWRIFEGKTLREVNQRGGWEVGRGGFYYTTLPRLTRHLQPRSNWPSWTSSVLFTHHILQIWPHRTTTCSLDWKKIERSPFFVRRGGHCCRGDLFGRTTFWIFLSGLQNLEQRAKNCIELRGNYVE